MINIEELKNKLNNYFEKLVFDEESHTYTINGNKLKSVSNFIKDYVEPFDSYAIAPFIAKKRSITVEEVLQEWKDISDKACEIGTITHLFGENFVEDRTLQPNSKLEEAIVKFWTDLPEHYIPVCLELKMFDVKKSLAGTADILLYNTKTDKYVIADYKTNTDLFKNYKEKKLLYPFNNLLDSPFGKYTIQLSTYQLLVQQIEGVEVEDRWLLWLKPDGTYQKYNTQDITETISSLFW